MYNEEIKKEYIKFAVESNRNLSVYLDMAFRKFEKYEEKYEKDLYDFNTSEIISVYKRLFYGSLETLLTMNSQMKKYTSYCLYRNLVADGQNHYSELDNEILYSCINNTLIDMSIVDKEQLSVMIEQLYNPSEKFILLAYFEGIRGKDACELINAKYNQINGNTFHLASGRDLEISDELKQYAKESSEEYEYFPYKTTDDSRERNFTFKETDERILKDLYNVNATEARTQKRNMHNKLLRLKDFLGCEAITAKSLRESGRINLLKSFMNGGKYNSFRECYIKNRDAIEYRYGALTSLDRWLMKYEKFL